MIPMTMAASRFLMRAAAFSSGRVRAVVPGIAHGATGRFAVRLGNPEVDELVEADGDAGRRGGGTERQQDAGLVRLRADRVVPDRQLLPHAAENDLLPGDDA